MLLAIINPESFKIYPSIKMFSLSKFYNVPTDNYIYFNKPFYIDSLLLIYKLKSPELKWAL